VSSAVGVSDGRAGVFLGIAKLDIRLYGGSEFFIRAGVLAAIAGLALCYVGSRGERRAMTWWGAATTTVGVAGFFLGAFTPDTASASSFAIIAAGGTLALTPYLIRKAAENKNSSGTSSG